MHLKLILLPLIICFVNAARRPRRIGLSYKYNDDILVYPGYIKFQFIEKARIDLPAFYYGYDSYSMVDHSGTHIDAPLHVLKGGQSVDEIEVDKFFFNAIMIDVSAKAKLNSNYAVQPGDLNFTKIELAYMNGRNNLLLIYTGWGAYWGNADAFLGNSDGDGSRLAFPGISEAAAKLLVEKKWFSCIGIDTISLDIGSSADFLAHRSIIPAGIYGIENVANLNLLPVREFFKVLAFPMNIEGATGAPIRIVAELGTRNDKLPSPFKYLFVF